MPAEPAENVPPTVAQSDQNGDPGIGTTPPLAGNGHNHPGVVPGSAEDNLQAIIGALDTLAHFVLHHDRHEKRRPTHLAVIDACRVVCSLVPMLLAENENAWHGIEILRAKVAELLAGNAENAGPKAGALWTPEVG